MNKPSSVEIAIRQCVLDDADALALIGQATFLEAFAGIVNGADILAHCAKQHASSVYREWLQHEQCRVWIAEATPGQAPIGYLALTPAALPIADPRADDLEVKRVYLLHRFQGSGVGKRLMAAASDYAKSQACRRLLLGVYAKNASAIAFYERLGFCRVGHRSFRVGGNNYDDLILSLTL
ncbi:MAG: GNAT family N-acetyltransferase [Candidatus Obscuribacterales bacterium]|nr:GNAT family N-acetyltransferase [Steroidobacteraceae bacterium]